MAAGVVSWESGPVIASMSRKAKPPYRKIVGVGATAMIVAHNHPSGALYPSENDKRTTKKLVSAAKTLDLTVLDHLIVTRSGYFSFSDQGLM